MIMLKLKKTFPRKNRERVRSKTVYIVRDWGADSSPAIGRMGTSAGYSRVIGWQSHDKKLASGLQPTKRCIYKYMEL